MTEAATKSASFLREYETVFLVKPDLTDENVDKVKEKFRVIVGREGGKFLRFTIWGKKKTQYLVAKQPRAIYLHAHYLGKSDLPSELERNMRNSDDVIRYMTIVLKADVDAASYESKALETLKVTAEVEDDGKFGGRHDHSDDFGAPGDDFAAGFEEEAV